MPAEFTSAEQMEKIGAPARHSRVGMGQNARLAAKLTGYKIDIKPESNPNPEPEAEA